MENISSKTKDYKTNIEKLTDSFLTSLNDEFSNLQEMMEYYHKNKNLEEELDNLQNQHILQINENKILEQKITNLEQKLISIPSLEKENIELTEKIKILEQLIEEKDKKMDELIHEHKEFNKVSQIKAAHTKLEEKNREIELLKQKLKNSNKTKNDKSISNSKKGIEDTTNTKKLEHTTKELEENSKEMEENSKEMEENSKEMEDTTKELEENSKELEENSKEMEDTTKELEENSKELEDMEEITYVKKKIKKILRYISEDENRYVYTILENDEVGEMIGQVINKKFVPLN